jgi:cell wall-associated NlpC family hydrolase
MKDDRSGSTPTNKKSKLYRSINIIGNAFFLLVGISIVGVNFYDNYRKNTIYNSLDMSFLSARVLEYGSSNYDVREFIDNIDTGVIKSYDKTVDTSTIGTQHVNFEIGKNDVSKEFAMAIEVVDTKKPIIEFNQNSISFYTGTKYDIKKNVKSVRDEVDGDIDYSSEEKKEKKNYYTVTSDLNTNKAGTYTVTVKAYDKNGNESSSTYKIVVKQKVVRQQTTQPYTAQGSYNGPSSIDTSSVVATARSLVGARYVYAGENPSTGFDCSGFVKYVYGLHGKYLAHGTLAQSRSGQAVSRENMQPGDIILWSTVSSNYPTHAAIYVGGDQMIHAANSRTGVIVSSVSQWEKYSTGHIAYIRRV